MNRTIWGGILLIIGTCVGGGMLALPLATASGGFLASSLFLILFWALMTYSAFLLLEVTLALPAGTNMISMAKATLGKTGSGIAWLSYLLLLYSLLCAYMSGGSGLVHALLLSLNIDIPRWLSVVLFAGVFGFIVYKGIAIVDFCNRFLMFSKCILFLALALLLLPKISSQQLLLGEFSALMGSMILIITAYGYAVIIPTLCDYYDRDTKKIKRIVAFGSLIPLVVYLIWQLSVLGTLPHAGANGLIAISTQSNPVSSLSDLISQRFQITWIKAIPHYFTSICILTSFLGVSLSLSDFLADGLKKTKTGLNNLWIFSLTFLPPVAILLIDPSIFILGLTYAGILTVILLVLLPGLMVWQARYRKKLVSEFRVKGGKLGLILQLTLGAVILIIACMETFHLI